MSTLNPAKLRTPTAASAWPDASIRYNTMQNRWCRVNNDGVGIPDSGRTRADIRCSLLQFMPAAPPPPPPPPPPLPDAIHEIRSPSVSPYGRGRQGGILWGAASTRLRRSGREQLFRHGVRVPNAPRRLRRSKFPRLATTASPMPADNLRSEFFSDKQNGFSVGGPIIRKIGVFLHQPGLGPAKQGARQGFSADGRRRPRNWPAAPHPRVYSAEFKYWVKSRHRKKAIFLYGIGQSADLVSGGVRPVMSNKFFGRGDLLTFSIFVFVWRFGSTTSSASSICRRADSRAR
jgi:hypothetical protein